MKNDLDLKQELIDLIEKFPTTFSRIITSKNKEYLLNYITSKTPLLKDEKFNVATKCYWIINDLHAFPVCKNCGNKIIRNLKIHDPYPQYCCRKCMQKSSLVKEHRENTNLNKYGCKSNLNFKSVQQKAITNSTTIEAKQKRKETCLKRYNHTSFLQSSEYKEQILEFLKKEYGNDITNFFQVEEIKEKIKQRIIEKYGVEYYTQTKEYLDKCHATNLKKYGVTHPNKLQKNRERISKLFSSEEFQTKLNLIKFKNHSFNKSKQEEICYAMLLSKFDNKDVYRQYYSEQYPYNCDFYIASIDTYIEYNGTWLHGGHPFDLNSKDDNEKLKKWKEKSTNFYKNAIEVWTIRDVKKRECAKNNNLNYIEFWNLKEVEKWINSKKNSNFQL